MTVLRKFSLAKANPQFENGVAEGEILANLGYQQGKRSVPIAAVMTLIGCRAKTLIWAP